MSTLIFKQALHDFRFLKNRFYSDKAALKLVADHYQLSSLERNLLLRGVVEKNKINIRLRKKVGKNKLRGKKLGLDWFNVLITIESYLKGFTLFLADDGLIRDAAQVHGSYRPSTVTKQATKAIIETLKKLAPTHLDIYFDSPISHSAKIKEHLEEELATMKLPFTFSLKLVSSADYDLKNYNEIIASSDSAIIDRANSFFDLAAEVLATNFNFKPFTLDKLKITQKEV